MLAEDLDAEEDLAAAATKPPSSIAATRSALRIERAPLMPIWVPMDRSSGRSLVDRLVDAEAPVESAWRVGCVTYFPSNCLGPE